MVVLGIERHTNQGGSIVEPFANKLDARFRENSANEFCGSVCSVSFIDLTLSSHARSGKAFYGMNCGVYAQRVLEETFEFPSDASNDSDELQSIEPSPSLSSNRDRPCAHWRTLTGLQFREVPDF